MLGIRRRCNQKLDLLNKRTEQKVRVQSVQSAEEEAEYGMLVFRIGMKGLVDYVIPYR